MAELSNIKKIEYENNKKVAGYNKKVLKFKTEVLANSLLKGFDIEDFNDAAINSIFAILNKVKSINVLKAKLLNSGVVFEKVKKIKKIKEVQEAKVAIIKVNAHNAHKTPIIAKVVIIEPMAKCPPPIIVIEEVKPPIIESAKKVSKYLIYDKGRYSEIKKIVITKMNMWECNRWVADIEKLNQLQEHLNNAIEWGNDCNIKKFKNYIQLKIDEMGCYAGFLMPDI